MDQPTVYQLLNQLNLIPDDLLGVRVLVIGRSESGAFALGVAGKWISVEEPGLIYQPFTQAELTFSLLVETPTAILTAFAEVIRLAESRGKEIPLWLPENPPNFPK